MVLTRFQWRYGGRQVLLVGSFSSWLEHYQMALVDGSPVVFQTICDLQPGFHQYRFLVDGVWRCDEQQCCVPADHGMVNNIVFVEEPNVLTPVPHYDPYISGTMRIGDGLHLAPPGYMPPGALLMISDAETQASRRWISNILSSQTIYDILPVSSKVFAVSAQLPVKQAFHIMYEEGLAVVPIWDDCRATITGMLTAADFILILRELQKSVRMFADEELEMHTVSAWKEGKSELYRQSNGPASVGLNLRPLIHVSDQDRLADIAIKILQNEISAVPIFRSVLPDSSCMPLLNIASIPVILKYICHRYGEVVGSLPFLQHPVCRIPVGTWLPETGRGPGHHLLVLQQSAPLSSALDLLLKGRISSIPVVDDDGSLIDTYSRSDIIALAKDDMYARIQLNQVTMNQALDLVYRAMPQTAGQRRCHTCHQSTPFFEVIQKLADPDVRRVVVIDPQSSRVEGIISLRDVARFFLG